MDNTSRKEDLISRQWIIDKLGITKECGYCQFHDGAYCNKTNFVDVCETIFEAPSVQQWIPVTVMLPKEHDKEYLVTSRTCHVYILKWCDDLLSQEYWKKIVTAWMPLPEPYEAKK